MNKKNRPRIGIAVFHCVIKKVRLGRIAKKLSFFFFKHPDGSTCEGSKAAFDSKIWDDFSDDPIIFP